MILFKLKLLVSVELEYAYALEMFIFQYYQINFMNMFFTAQTFEIKSDCRNLFEKIIYLHYLLEHLTSVIFHAVFGHILVLILMMRDQGFQFLHFCFPIIGLFLLKPLLCVFDHGMLE